MIFQTTVEQQIGSRTARQGVVFAGVNLPLTTEQRTELTTRLTAVSSYLDGLLPVQQAAAGGQPAQTTEQQP